MGLSPIELSGGIQRVQDYAVIKHNLDNKGTVDQANIQGQVEKQVSDKTQTVEHADNANNELKKFDAKEKGSGSYAGDGGKKRDKKKPADGTVRPKGGTSTFDIRI